MTDTDGLILIDATYAGLLTGATDTPLVIPALNRDGDCLSDLVIQMFGSIAGAESVLLALEDADRVSRRRPVVRLARQARSSRHRAARNREDFRRRRLDSSLGRSAHPWRRRIAARNQQRKGQQPRGADRRTRLQALR